MFSLGPRLLQARHQRLHRGAAGWFNGRKPHFGSVSDLGSGYIFIPSKKKKKPEREQMDLSTQDLFPFL